MSLRPLVLFGVLALAGCVVINVPAGTSSPRPTATPGTSATASGTNAPSPRPSTLHAKADTFQVVHKASPLDTLYSFTMTVERSGKVTYAVEGQGLPPGEDNLPDETAKLFADLDGPWPTPPQTDCALARADVTTVTYAGATLTDATGCASPWPGQFLVHLQRLESMVPVQRPGSGADPTPTPIATLAGAWDLKDATSPGSFGGPCVSDGFLLDTADPPGFQRLAAITRGGAFPAPTPTPASTPVPTPTPQPSPVVSWEGGHLLVTTGDGERFDLTYNGATDTLVGTHTPPNGTAQAVTYVRKPGATAGCEILAP